MTPRPLRRASLGVGFSLRTYLRAAEAGLLADALARGGDAARLLGVSKRTLRYLIAKHRPSRKVAAAVERRTITREATP